VIRTWNKKEQRRKKEEHKLGNYAGQEQKMFIARDLKAASES